jgi:hypothetical protein
MRGDAMDLSLVDEIVATAPELDEVVDARCARDGFWARVLDERREHYVLACSPGAGDDDSVSALIPIHHPWIDESRAPLYVMKFPASTTDEDLLACCDAREVWAERARYPVTWVVDMSSVRSVTPRQRQMFGAHLGRMDKHNFSYNRGASLIVPNAVVRGMVTAAFWIKPPRFPHRLFATRAEGLVWAQEQLRVGHARGE